MKDSDLRDNLIVWGTIGLLVVLVTVAACLLNQYLYGDWRCAFAHCRLEK